MGFFEDYSNLSSEGILEKILNGEIDYTIFWYSDGEEGIREKREWGIRPHGVFLIEYAAEHEDSAREGARSRRLGRAVMIPRGLLARRSLRSILRKDGSS
jgi:hypothetical protein